MTVGTIGLTAAFIGDTPRGRGRFEWYLDGKKRALQVGANLKLELLPRKSEFLITVRFISSRGQQVARESRWFRWVDGMLIEELPETE